MFRKIFLWVMVILCMGTIFFLSSQVAKESAKTSSDFVRKVIKVVDVLHKCPPETTEKIIDKFTFITRKCAHMFIYSVLGFFVFLLVREYGFMKRKLFIISMSVNVLYACSDEFHQLFVEGRSGEIRDVFIDSLGALTGIFVAWCFLKLIRKILERKNKNELQGNL